MNNRLFLPKGTTFSHFVYDVLRIFFLYVLHGFFREVRSRGAHKIPAGPVIFAVGPHANQFVDPIVLMTNTLRRVGFLIARKSWEQAYVGSFAKLFGAIPVIRPQDIVATGVGSVFLDPGNPRRLLGIKTRFTVQVRPKFLISLYKTAPQWEVDSVVSDTELLLKAPVDDKEDLLASHRASVEDPHSGSAYQITPHVNQRDMFEYCFRVLGSGGAVGIFPEGGSHDRSEMLPFKPGVSMMALGASERFPGLDVKIVPVGLHYFHGDTFRSRAVVEFGDPISVPSRLVAQFQKGGAAKRAAVAILLDTVQTAVRALTVTAPDFDTLMIAQAARRIYRPFTSHLTLDDVLELSRRITAGYTRFRHARDVQHFTARLAAYHKHLEYMGLRDHQVKQLAARRLAACGRLVLRVAELLFLVLLGSLGVAASAPIWSVAILVSRRKMVEAKAGSSVKVWGKDVVASWKVMTGLLLAPFFHIFYTALVYGLCLLVWHCSAVGAAFYAFVTYILLPLGAFETLRVFDSGIDLWRSLKPLQAAIFHSASAIEQLKLERIACMELMVDLIDLYGPKIYGSKFDEIRLVKSEDIRKSILLEKLEISSTSTTNGLRKSKRSDTYLSLSKNDLDVLLDSDKESMDSSDLSSDYINISNQLRKRNLLHPTNGNNENEIFNLDESINNNNHLNNTNNKKKKNIDFAFGTEDEDEDEEEEEAEVEEENENENEKSPSLISSYAFINSSDDKLNANNNNLTKSTDSLTSNSTAEMLTILNRKASLLNQIKKYSNQKSFESIESQNILGDMLSFSDFQFWKKESRYSALDDDDDIIINNNNNNNNNIDDILNNSDNLKQ